MGPDPNTNFHRYRVGDIEVNVVSDGYMTIPLVDGFIPNATLAEVQAALASAGLPVDRLTTTFAPVLFRNGSSTTLIDTGVGPDIGAAPGSTMGLLTHNMAQNGITPADVAVVVISHFHQDHVNGLVSREGVTFANAVIKVPEQEWLFWMSDDEMRRADDERTRKLFQNNRRIFEEVRDHVEIYRWGDEIVPGLHAVATPGHSVGHTSFWLRSGTEELFIQSDLSNQPPLFVEHPEWYSVLDQFPEEAILTRRRIYEMLADKAVALQAFHHPFPGHSRLVRAASGYRIVPVT